MLCLLMQAAVDAGVDASTPAPVDAPAVDAPVGDAPAAEDDLFGKPEPEAAVPAVPAEAPNAEGNADVDDLFKDSSYRNWKDNTGNFSVRAKLIVIYGDSVRLLKDNGHTSTVPFRRLSETDRQFVADALAKLSRDANTQLVDFSQR